MAFSESQVLAERFWWELDGIAARAQNSEYVEQAALLVLFLTQAPERGYLDERPLKVVGAPSSERSWARWLASLQNEQEKALAELYMNVARALGYPGDAETLDTFEDPQLVRELLHRISRFIDGYALEHEGAIEAAFDLGFLRTLSSIKGADATRERYLGSLASSLAGLDVETVAEAFHSSGQCGIDISRMSERPVRYVVGRYAERGTLALAMRLALKNVPFEIVDLHDRSSVRKLLKYRPDILLLGPPASSRGRRRSGNHDTVPPYDLAIELEKSRADYGVAFLVVPTTLATIRGQSEELRRELVERGQVVAVIDLPVTSVNKMKFSCWVIRGRLTADEWSRGNNVLCVDGKALAHFSTGRDYFPDADFIGRIISLIPDRAPSGLRPIAREGKRSELLDGIFLREFGRGYRDVPGLCALVSVEQLAANNFALAAQSYVLPIRNESWLAGFDWGALRHLLEAPASHGRALYLIGNNGQGKSLLLERIALDYARSGRRTLAMALGTSDRFPKSLRNVNYLYLGTRTSAASINLRGLASSAARHVLEIHSDSKRMHVFNKISSLLEFSSEHFLVPVEVGGEEQIEHSPLRGVIRMSSASVDDALAIEGLTASSDGLRKFKLGLRRKGDHDRVVPFDELSSGEQQVILLVSRIVANAELGAVALIDEPEISLHVRWQRAIPKLLSIIAGEFGMDVVVATHSPVLVASAVGEEDYCFRVKDRAVTAISPEDRQSVETALFEGFETHTPNNRDIHERCAALVGHCIELGAREELDSVTLIEIMDKLDSMMRIVEGGSSLGLGSIGDDIDLILRTKAVIGEAFKQS